MLFVVQVVAFVILAAAAAFVGSLNETVRYFTALPYDDILLLFTRLYSSWSSRLAAAATASI